MTPSTSPTFINPSSGLDTTTTADGVAVPPVMPHSTVAEQPESVTATTTAETPNPDALDAAVLGSGPVMGSTSGGTKIPTAAPNATPLSSALSEAPTKVPTTAPTFMEIF